MVYSASGQDRGHHPEVCQKVAGRMENSAGSGTVQVEGEGAPVQQFLFGRHGELNWVYYWYYTLKSERGEGVSDLQRLYQRNRQRESSVTLQVFAENPDSNPRVRPDVVEFVKLIDGLAQKKLPQGALRGSDRSPVKVVEEH
jgi:hypothetical protein